MMYPAPGDPDLARHVVKLVGERRASVDGTWGLDHGTWSVLVHLRPAADVPVVQLSIDGRLAPEEHLAVGRALERHEADHLVRALESDAGRLSHPTPDHYLPLLYAAGASTQNDAVRFPIDGFDMASLSMRSVVFG
jgi:4,5-DOPA dioxygenase extradiol